MLNAMTEMNQIIMEEFISEAKAHYKQLIALGASENEAARDTVTAFDLTEEEILLCK